MHLFVFRTNGQDNFGGWTWAGVTVGGGGAETRLQGCRWVAFGLVIVKSLELEVACSVTILSHSMYYSYLLGYLNGCTSQSPLTIRCTCPSLDLICGPIQYLHACQHLEPWKH